MAWLFALTLLACTACSGEPPGPGLGTLAGASADSGGESTSCNAEPLRPSLRPQCPSTFVEGIDVFDGQGTIDWPALAAAAAGPATGVRFAFIKATQGLANTQLTFAANWAGAASAHLARGAYHFFDPRDDGVAQANHFLSVLGAGDATPTDLPPMVDVECPDGDADCLGPGVSGVADAADVRQRLQDWLRTVEQVTGRRPILYTFSSYFGSSGVDPTGLDRYPLFLAYPTRAACFAVPRPWSRATLWQYSWTGQIAGIAAAVDRDRFLGSLEDLTRLARPAGRDAADAAADAAEAPAAPAAVSDPPTDPAPSDAAPFRDPAATHCL